MKTLILALIIGLACVASAQQLPVNIQTNGTNSNFRSNVVMMANHSIANTHIQAAQKVGQDAASTYLRH